MDARYVTNKHCTWCHQDFRQCLGSCQESSASSPPNCINTFATFAKHLKAYIISCMDLCIWGTFVWQICTWVADDAKCIVVMHVCVCLSAAASPHYRTDQDVTWGVVGDAP